MDNKYVEQLDSGMGWNDGLVESTGFSEELVKNQLPTTERVI